MNIDRIEDAISEAKRFLKRVEELKAAGRAPHEPWAMFPKETGAVRRSSLDLTRALSALRQRGA